jgi:hypothetical protein
VGVINTRPLHQIIEAKTTSQGFHMPGALWKTQVEVTEALALSDHCQATCDLLLRVENDPSLLGNRRRICKASPSRWANALYDGSDAIERRAIAALCFGGFMNARRPGDPSAVFEICAESGCSEIAALAQSAWRLSRNPMALLLPLVWQHSQAWSRLPTADDPMATAEAINGVPEYALDQFTRIGKAVARQLVGLDPKLQSLLASTGANRSEWPQLVGDVIFLFEGGVCVRRSTSQEGEALRRPARWLPSIARFGAALQPAIMHIASKRRQLLQLRRQIFQRPHTGSIC